MTAYRAPVADLLFTIQELAGMAEISQFSTFRDVTPDLIEAILEEAGKIGSDVLAPLNRSGDQQGCQLENGVVRTPDGFKEAYRQFIDNGWNGMPFEPKYGGQGLPWLLTAAVGEIVQAANMSFGLCPLLTQGAVELLAAHGSDNLKSTYLPNMVAGVWNGTMNLTEPSAGSDLASIRTKAVRDGTTYRITGTKIFITYGETDFTENIIHMVLARLDDAPEGIKGISLFVVPKYLVKDDGSLGHRNDLKAVSLEHKLGIHASPTAVMSFGDNEGARGFLVGEENRGIEYMFTMMNNARLTVGVQGVAIAERAYQQALAYARDRVQSRQLGSPAQHSVAIIEHPDVKRMLLTMKTKTEAARALALFVAGKLDISKSHPEPAARAAAFTFVDLLTPVVKAWSSDIGIEVANMGIQVHGGMGFIEESGAPQHLRDARIAAIYEGTNGIQANDLVGRKIGKDKGVAVGVMSERIHTFLADHTHDSCDGLEVVCVRLERAVNALDRASQWIVDTYSTSPTQVAAGAVPYLELLGRTVGGWLLARAAFLARTQLRAGASGNPGFLQGKLVSARFFADHVLIGAEGLADTVIFGFKSVEEIKSGDF